MVLLRQNFHGRIKIQRPVAETQITGNRHIKLKDLKEPYVEDTIRHTFIILK